MGKASSEAKNRWNAKNYDRIGVMVPKGHKAEIAAHAAACGESVNGFIGRAIMEAMERDTAQKPTECTDGGGNAPIPPDAKTPSEAAQNAGQGA